MISFIQFQPWKECNNCCKFCYAAGAPKISAGQKAENLKFIYDKITEYAAEFSNSIVGLIGGEFFTGQLEDDSVEKAFYDIVDLCGALNRKQKVLHLYLATSLIFPYCRIKKLLDYIEEKRYDPEMLVICTSYDLKYRFHTSSDFAEWEANINLLKTSIKNPVHIEIILSQFFINAYLNGQFNLNAFRCKYSPNVDFIEPLRIRNIKSRTVLYDYMPDFFLKRNDFLRFVHQACIKTKDIDIQRLLSMKYHSDVLFTYDETQHNWLNVANRNASNIREFDDHGEKLDTISYCDSTKLIEDDINNIRKIFNS